MTASDSSAAEAQNQGPSQGQNQAQGQSPSQGPGLQAPQAGDWGLGPAWATPPGVPELPPDDGSGMVSIGVTLDVPEPYGSQLRSLRVSLGDARGTSVPAHITLIPPMEIPASAWPIVREHIRAGGRACARMPANRSGGWSGSSGR